MHTHTCRMDDEQAKRIEKSVLERCSPHGSVLHIYVDRKSTFVSVHVSSLLIAMCSRK